MAAGTGGTSNLHAAEACDALEYVYILTGICQGMHVHRGFWIIMEGS